MSICVVHKDRGFRYVSPYDAAGFTGFFFNESDIVDTLAHVRDIVTVIGKVVDNNIHGILTSEGIIWNNGEVLKPVIVITSSIRNNPAAHTICKLSSLEGTIIAMQFDNVFRVESISLRDLSMVKGYNKRFYNGIKHILHNFHVSPDARLIIRRFRNYDKIIDDRYLQPVSIEFVARSLIFKRLRVDEFNNAARKAPSIQSLFKLAPDLPPITARIAKHVQNLPIVLLPSGRYLSDNAIRIHKPPPYPMKYDINDPNFAAFLYEHIFDNKPYKLVHGETYTITNEFIIANSSLRKIHVVHNCDDNFYVDTAGIITDENNVIRMITPAYSIVINDIDSERLYVNKHYQTFLLYIDPKDYVYIDTGHVIKGQQLFST